jgi:hypothetical protein
VRTWPGLAAIGAGLIHLGSAPTTPPLVLAVLVTAGAAELLWGVAALARPAPPVPEAAIGGLLGIGVLTVEALLLPSAAARHGAEVVLGLPTGAVLGAAALDLVVGAIVATFLVRGRPVPGEQRAVPFLLLAAVAAGVIAVVTTQSLSATSVGGTMHMH